MKKKPKKLTGEAFKKKMAEAKAIKKTDALTKNQPSPKPLNTGIKAPSKKKLTKQIPQPATADNQEIFTGRFFKDNKGMTWAAISQSPDAKKICLLSETEKKIWVGVSALREKFKEIPQDKPQPQEPPKIETPFGRPMKIDTIEELDAAIASYFEKCEKRTKKRYNMFGQEYVVSAPAPESVIGLCVHLGITRETMRQWEERPDFSDSITRAKNRCELYAVNACYEGERGNKADFVLKNNFREDWSDRHKIELTDETDVAKRIIAARHKLKKPIKPGNETSS